MRFPILLAGPSLALGLAGCMTVGPALPYDGMVSAGGRPPDITLVRPDGGSSYQYRFVQGPAIDDFTVNFGLGNTWAADRCTSFSQSSHAPPPSNPDGSAVVVPTALSPGLAVPQPDGSEAVDPAAPIPAPPTAGASTDAGQTMLTSLRYCRG